MSQHFNIITTHMFSNLVTNILPSRDISTIFPLYSSGWGGCKLIKDVNVTISQVDICICRFTPQRIYVFAKFNKY